MSHCCQREGISAEIEIFSPKGKQVDEDNVARGKASRQRLKFVLGLLIVMTHLSCQREGISAEIEILPSPSHIRLQRRLPEGRHLGRD